MLYRCEKPTRNVRRTRENACKSRAGGEWFPSFFLCSPNIARGFITPVILLPEKFLQYDWLRADVFQLNLKYLHVKITVSMVTPNHHIISPHELRKNGGKISRFWNQEIQELKENSENQNTKKSTSTWLNVWTKLGRKQELRKQFARLRSETTRRK